MIRWDGGRGFHNTGTVFIYEVKETKSEQKKKYQLNSAAQAYYFDIL